MRNTERNVGTGAPVVESMIHPLVVASVLLVALNDHVFKGAGWLPGAVTGKLSDVAGLFFFPVLVAALLSVIATRLSRWIPALVRTRRHEIDGVVIDVAVGVTVAGFVAVNVVDPINSLASRYWGVFTMDATDLLCLPMAALARQFLRRRSVVGTGEEESVDESPRSTFAWPHYTAIFVAAVVSLGTPATPVTVSGVPTWRLEDPVVHCRHGVEIATWIARSGKSGVGVVLRFDAGVESREVDIENAEFLAWRDRGPPTNPSLRIESDPVEPVVVEERNSVYLPFEFDNEGAWNDGLHRGEFIVDLAIDDRSFSLEYLAEHRSAPWTVRIPRDRRPLDPPAESSGGIDVSEFSEEAQRDYLIRDTAGVDAYWMRFPEGYPTECREDRDE